MPAPAEILESARRIANDAFALAVFWHAWVAAGIVMVWRGRASERRAGNMLAVLLASVSGVSFAFGNPFNGFVVGAVALALAFAANGLSTADVRPGSPWAVIAGAVLIALGWAYPEFVGRPYGFLYGSPLGLLPCPTLALLIGATLFLDGLGSRAWSLILAAAGLFYGLYGALVLGVRIDMLLAAGALTLGASVLLPALPRRRAT